MVAIFSDNACDSGVFGLYESILQSAVMSWGSRGYGIEQGRSRGEAVTIVTVLNAPHFHLDLYLYIYIV